MAVLDILALVLAELGLVFPLVMVRSSVLVLTSADQPTTS